MPQWEEMHIYKQLKVRKSWEQNMEIISVKLEDLIVQVWWVHKEI